MIESGKKSPPSELASLASPVLIVGPAHSGKSELAHDCLVQGERTVVIGTGMVQDPEGEARILALKAMRPAGWRHVETSRDLPAVIAEEAAGATDQILIDSVSQWLAAEIVDFSDPGGGPGIGEWITNQRDELVRVIRGTPGRLVIVTAEVGGGPAPARGAERLYRRNLGLLNQALAGECATVIQVSCGLAHLLKGGKGP